VTLDLREISLIAASLSDRQIQHGGQLICGDPAQPSAAYRQALRAGVLEAILRARDELRVLATLDEGQWNRLPKAGLRVAYDLTPEQSEALGFPLPGAAIGAATASGPPGRRGRGGARMGGGPGRPFGFGPPPGEGEQDLADMVMRLTDEPPPGRRFRRGGAPPPPDPGADGGRSQAPGWRSPVRESQYLELWAKDELRSAFPLPRTLQINLTRPTMIGPA
jgi:hypothetical protein